MEAFRPIPILLACLFLTSAPAFGAERSESESEPEDSFLEAIGVAEGESRLPGVGLAEGLTQITGVAISPLLGVSALGAWNYFRTEPENRHLLPWVCRPVFWGIGFGILAIVFFKDAIGTIVPAFLKEPLDLIELFEDKFSALIAGTAFIPFIVEQYALHEGPVGVDEPLAGTATIPVLAEISPLWILTPLALAGFAVVWVVSHTINVLIVLSPFGFLDALLKLGRFCVLSLMVVFYMISPVIAAFLAMIITAVCAYLAPSAFRLGFYGSVVSADYFRSVFRRESPDPGKIRCFLAKRGNRRLKVRTLGRVASGTDGHVLFRSRRLFFGPWRSVRLPANGALFLTNGFIFPTVEAVCGESGRTETLLHLLPRYRHHGESVAELLGVEFRETPMLRGFNATKQWITKFLRAGREQAIEAMSSSGEIAV